jgi:hypothetical protein
MKQLFIVLLFPLALKAQNKILISRDTMTYVKSLSWPHAHEKMMALILTDGTLVEGNSIVKLGKGTLPNGDFNYIATQSN